MLGFDSMVAIDHPGFSTGDFHVIPGIIINVRTISALGQALKRSNREGMIVLVNAGDTTFNRAALGMKGVRVLRNVYVTDRHSFDHVSARIATDKSVAIDIDLYPIIHFRGVQRQRVLERYYDVIRLQERFGFDITLSSGATSILDQRSPAEMIGLCSLFGMTGSGASHALSSVARILKPRPLVEVVS